MLWVLLGCASLEDVFEPLELFGSGEEDVDPSIDVSAPADELDATVEWTPSSIVVTLYSMDPGGHYRFGLAETGCGDPDSCWFGEDCVYGYADYFYCHPVDDGLAVLVYGGDINALEEGTETLFTSPDFGGYVTYYLEDARTGECMVWGDDPSYYAGLGCQE